MPGCGVEISGKGGGDAGRGGGSVVAVNVVVVVVVVVASWDRESICEDRDDGVQVLAREAYLLKQCAGEAAAAAAKGEASRRKKYGLLLAWLVD